MGLGSSGKVRSRDGHAKRSEERAGILSRPSALIAGVLRGLVRGYQLALSPFLPAACRFHPTCSQYALEALERHGPVRGSWLATRRIARCHPWCTGGHDPVP